MTKVITIYPHFCAGRKMRIVTTSSDHSLAKTLHQLAYFGRRSSRCHLEEEDCRTLSLKRKKVLLLNYKCVFMGIHFLAKMPCQIFVSKGDKLIGSIRLSPVERLPI